MHRCAVAKGSSWERTPTGGVRRYNLLNLIEDPVGYVVIRCCGQMDILVVLKPPAVKLLNSIPEDSFTNG